MPTDLPSGWRVIPLREAGLTTRRPTSFPGLRPYLATADVRGFDLQPAEDVTFAGRPARADLLISEGDVLQAKMKATNKAVLVGAEQQGWLASTGFAQFAPDPNVVLPQFLFHWIGSEDFCTKKDALCVGSTQQAISESWLGAMGLAVCHPSEQRRIAAILDTLDEAIRRTEQVIAKLQQMKQGLLHDLLTRGVDENGDLRPLPNEAPHLYKNSPMGRIPTQWNVVEIGNLGEVVTGSTPPSKIAGVWGQGLPFVTPSEVLSDGELSPSLRSVSEKGQRYVRRVPTGSVVVVCIGSTLGKMALTSGDCATNQQIHALIPRAGMSPLFLDAAIRLRVSELLVLAGLQAVPIVNRTLFESIRIAVAPEHEQVAIAAHLDIASQRTRSEQLCLGSMRSVKVGLLHDLLTGHVRVPMSDEVPA